MKQLLFSLFTLYVCATSIAQDTVVVPVYILDSIPVPERLECVPEFSPDNFRLPEGVTLDSVIRKLPGVEVLTAPLEPLSQTPGEKASQPRL